uniref:carbonic anhydrase n=1 Tax=Lotharella globosa TaxID=91324 RepID=A0A7S4DW44_9EUKA|mmetsp:Transcript_3161/g.6195  ORF Transcript_3161/g.6195 Transcript_3161/m.6195 type:complete len:477 (+) Transcript_3161:54-1484(+)
MLPGPAFTRRLILLLYLVAQATAVSLTWGYGYNAAPSCTYSSTLLTKSGYTEHGPYCWGSYDSTCSGSNQSPINLNLAEPPSSHYEKLRFTTHSCTQAAFYNSGHSWEVNLHSTCEKQLEVDFNHVAYHLESMSFHSPSEHTIGSSRFDGELQLVHQSSDHKELIISLLFKASSEDTAANGFLDFIFGTGSNLKTGIANNATANWTRVGGSQDTYPTSRAISPYTDIIPANPAYYAYIGSLTHPPCTESVQWVVMAQPLRMSRTQVQYFRQGLSSVHGNTTNIHQNGQYGNSRPVQPRNGRPVYFYAGAPEDHSAHSSHEDVDGIFFSVVLLPLAYFASFMGLLIVSWSGLFFAGGFLIWHALAWFFWLAPEKAESCVQHPTMSEVSKISMSFMRFRFLKGVVLSLEVLVAADVIDLLTTPMDAATFELLGIISIVVVIRTVLSYHMTHEYEELEQEYAMEREEAGHERESVKKLV